MAPSHMFSCKCAVTGCYVCLQCPGRCLDDGTLALHSTVNVHCWLMMMLLLKSVHGCNTIQYYTVLVCF